MSLEVRHSNQYYYRASKIDGRVVKQYFGAGEVAIAKALQDRRDREAAKRQRVEVEQADQELAALCRSLNLLTTAALEIAGYQQHDRGAWRRKRESSNT